MLLLALYWKEAAAGGALATFQLKIRKGDSLAHFGQILSHLRIPTASREVLLPTLEMLSLSRYTAYTC